MIYKSENHIRFDRENKTLYEVILNKGVEQSVPLFVFEQYFPDKTDLPKSAIKYLKDYMLDYPTLWKEAKEVGEMPAHGMYSCYCCLFENHIEAKKARSIKYQLSDFVKNRCVNQRTEIGIVIEKNEQNGYYNVRFGPEQSDIELKHAEEIIKI